MKKVLEILISLILHPIAVILMWINVLGRRDLNRLQKTIWIVIGIVYVGPILYVIFGGGDLW